MTTLESLSLESAIDDVLGSLIERAGKPDLHAPKKQELALRALLYDRWDRQVEIARHGLSLSHSFLLAPSSDLVPRYMAAFNKAFSGDAITNGLDLRTPIAEAFTIGKVSVDSQYHKQTGKLPPVKKDMMFGALFGLTEQHALQALNEQIMIAAGSFWDDQLQESIKKEMESWFTGTITREELTEKLMTLVNDRLATEGRSLARSYFDNLATHIVNRSRDIGGHYRAKALGAQSYKLYNPHDRRTSAICLAVTQGQVYSVAGAEQQVVDILQSRATAELKEKVPFLTPATASSAENPVPPLHFGGCRTIREYLFKGLNE